MKVSLHRLRRGPLLRQLLRHTSKRATMTVSHKTAGAGQRSLSSARPLSEDAWDPHEYSPVKDPVHYPSPPFPYTHMPASHPSTSVEEESFATATVAVEQHMTPAQELTLSYTKDSKIPITSTLRLVKPEEDAPRGIWPVFRLMVRTEDNSCSARFKSPVRIPTRSYSKKSDTACRVSLFSNHLHF